MSSGVTAGETITLGRQQGEGETPSGAEPTPRNAEPTRDQPPRE